MHRQTLSKRDQIIQLRTENPIIRITQIADKVGVYKSYVHKVLKNAELPTKSILIARKNLPKRIDCRACGEDIPKSATHAERVHHIHDECRYEYHYILVNCKFCRKSFKRRRWHLKNSSSEYIYCSKKCLYKFRKDESTYDLRLNKQLKQKKIDSPDLI